MNKHRSGTPYEFCISSCGCGILFGVRCRSGPDLNAIFLILLNRLEEVAAGVPLRCRSTPVPLPRGPSYSGPQRIRLSCAAPSPSPRRSARRSRTSGRRRNTATTLVTPSAKLITSTVAAGATSFTVAAATTARGLSGGLGGVNQNGQQGSRLYPLMMMAPEGSTSAVQPGGTRVVASNCVMMAGPEMQAPAPMPERS